MIVEPVVGDSPPFLVTPHIATRHKSLRPPPGCGSSIRQSTGSL